MKILFTYRPRFTSTNIGGYRYFFNGQESDNEVFGIGGFQNYGFRMYDTRIARFWSVDPMTKDFPMLSPFQFASNTPIWGVDIDGLEVRVYVETPQYLMGNVGHVFLSVGTADDIIVYSYGRYGELEKDKGPLNFTNRRGEGVLNRLTGNTAASYIKKNLSKNNVSVFEIKDASEDVVQESFDQIFYNYGKASSSERLKNNPEARVIDQYDLFNNNCTTKTIDALIEGGSKESFKIMELIYAPSTYFGLGTTYIYENMVNTPEEMFRYLLRHATEEDNVKIITKDMKNEYQKSSD